MLLQKQFRSVVSVSLIVGLLSAAAYALTAGRADDSAQSGVLNGEHAPVPLVGDGHNLQPAGNGITLSSAILEHPPGEGPGG
ncbi:hypothetical protein IIA15_09630, partial [candidate division TA06 bacterium]|nr:hypothetical protein [candidate division TA06 bacterium]